MRREVNTTEILSPEDKKYLRRISNYLNSMGMQDGTIEIDFDGEHGDISEIDYEQITHFSNNYYADIPDGLIPIIKKINSLIAARRSFLPNISQRYLTTFNLI